MADIFLDAARENKLKGIYRPGALPQLADSGVLEVDCGEVVPFEVGDGFSRRSGQNLDKSVIRPSVVMVA